MYNLNKNIRYLKKNNQQTYSSLGKDFFVFFNKIQDDFLQISIKENEIISELLIEIKALNDFCNYSMKINSNFFSRFKIINYYFNFEKKDIAFFYINLEEFKRIFSDKKNLINYYLIKLLSLEKKATKLNDDFSIFFNHFENIYNKDNDTFFLELKEIYLSFKNDILNLKNMMKLSIINLQNNQFLSNNKYEIINEILCKKIKFDKVEKIKVKIKELID